jgi:hypothetical protein
MLGVYTPGTTFEMYGDDGAKLLKGGENLYLNCNIHYQAIGEPVKDKTKVAFWFRSDAPKQQLFRVPASGETIIAQGQQLLMDASGEKAEGTLVSIPPIPPGAKNFEVIGITAFREPVTIFQMQPHAHLRGKDFEYSVVYPDGREQTLLTVPKYDFHWQLAYELETPLQLPAGAKLIVTAHYDNSANNENLMHHHHDGEDGPQKEIHFREENQSWDEMFTPFIQYSIDDRNPSEEKRIKLTQENSRQNQSSEHPESAPMAKGLPITEVVGCLEQAGPERWILNRAGEPILSATQGTSSGELAEAGTRKLGIERDDLIGADVFNPSHEKGKKVAAKGVLIKHRGATRLNITSLQEIGGGGCS